MLHAMADLLVKSESEGIALAPILESDRLQISSEFNGVGIFNP